MKEKQATVISLNDYPFCVVEGTDEAIVKKAVAEAEDEIVRRGWQSARNPRKTNVTSSLGMLVHVVKKVVPIFGGSS